MTREEMIATAELRRCGKSLSDAALLCPSRADSLRAFALVLYEWAALIESGQAELEDET